MEVKRLMKFEGGGSLKAFCDLAIGDVLLIRGVRVIDGKNGIFVSMPRQQAKNGKWFDHVSVLAPAFKKKMDEVVLEAYQHGPINGELDGSDAQH
jgi:stage V sporulation protein G